MDSYIQNKENETENLLKLLKEKDKNFLLKQKAYDLILRELSQFLNFTKKITMDSHFFII